MEGRELRYPITKPVLTDKIPDFWNKSSLAYDLLMLLLVVPFTCLSAMLH